MNICDTENNPNVLGVRASMPGNGTNQTMWMRFFASYFDRATEKWHEVGGTAAHPGSSSATRGSAPPGRSELRHQPALPIYEPSWSAASSNTSWRQEDGKVVRRAPQMTLAGHPTGRHGDPRGYSAGVCEINSPRGSDPLEIPDRVAAT